MAYNTFTGIFTGYIDEVYPPSHEFNRSKYQYEYLVILNSCLNAAIPCRCIRMDYGFGGLDNYEDETLAVGYSVLVEFPNQDSGTGIIIGGIRNIEHPIAEAGHRWRKRFKTIDQMIDQDGNYIVAYRTTDTGDPEELKNFGPNVIIEKDHVRIQTGDGQDSAAYAGGSVDSIILHGDTRTISIITKNWNVRVANKCTIYVEGDCEVKANNLTATVAKDATIKTGSLNVKVDKDAKIDVGKNADITATQVTLNGKEGDVITTATQPTCYVTGIPFQGSKTVKAGG